MRRRFMVVPWISLTLLVAASAWSSPPQGSVTVFSTRPMSHDEVKAFQKIPGAKLFDIPDHKLMSQAWRHQMFEKAGLLRKITSDPKTFDPYGESLLLWLSISEEPSQVLLEFPKLQKQEVARLSLSVRQDLSLAP